MAVYLTSQIDISNVQILDIKFHKKLDFLAISVIKESAVGNILIANNNGQIFENCTVSQSIPTSCILWHPSKSFLAIGWTDGGLTIYDSIKNLRFDAPQIHELPIASFSWSSHGSRLVSADIEGNLHSWKIDFQGGFGHAPIYSYSAGCPINCIVLRMAKMSGNDVYDIRELARAAVSGDEKALDLMSWGSSNNKSSHSTSGANIKFTGYSYVEVATFLAGLGDGRIILINENGKVFNIASLEGSVVRMLYHEERDIFIATTDVGMLTHHELLADGTSSREVMKVKLACRTPNPSLIWAGSTTLAICLGELKVRMWDIDREENYTLQTDEIMGYLENTQINVIDYNSSEKTLVAGTNKGQIINWKLQSDFIDKSTNTKSEHLDPENQWCLQPATTMFLEDGITSAGSIEKVVASSTHLVAVTTSSNIMFLLEEANLLSCFNSGIIIQQIANKEFIIQLYDTTDDSATMDSSSSGIKEFNPNISDDLLSSDNGVVTSRSFGKKLIKGNNKFYTIAVEHSIKNIACSLENLIISDGKNIYSYELDFQSPEIVKICGKFECSTAIIKVHQQNLFVYDKSELQIRNFQGTVKQITDLSGMDGTLEGIGLNNNFMICFTDKCCLRIFDLSRRDPKPLTPVKYLGDSIPSITKIHSASINSNGTCASIIIERQRRGPEPKLYFWNIDYDNIQYFNFNTGLSDQDDSSNAMKLMNNNYDRTAIDRGANKRTRSRLSVKSGKRSARKSARSKNRRRRQQTLVDGGQGDIQPFSVTESILYDDDDEDDDEFDVDDGQYDSGMEDGKGFASPSDSDNLSSRLTTSSMNVDHSLPIFHLWDKSDPRIVVTEIIPFDEVTKNLIIKSLTTTKLENYPRSSTKVVSLFATQDDGILVFDSYLVPQEYSKLIGFDTPFFYFSSRIDIAYKKRVENSGINSFILSRVMRDFQGLELFDKTNKKAILNFSYYLTIGNMDEAFKAMKLIKSEQVWKNMARMCVKTRRLDVAAVCLGKMGQGRAAMHLREAHQTVSQMDAKIAILALQLGMKEEAIQLLEKSQRYDILNELYQAMAEWDKALDIAEKYDRIHLKTTYYNYAKYLEVEKRYSEAIENFVKSGTHAFEVPRMLFDRPQDLEDFIKERPEKSLKKWWAQYMECCGHMKIALEFYAAAQDYLSLVRAYWLLGMEQKAQELCNDTGDSAACYHLARQFEAAGDVDQAVHYFSRAKAYNSAIRLCQENNRDDHIVNLALLGTKEDQIATACYLQNRPGYADKAVMLFHKAGQAGRAIDLALRTQQFGALQYVSNELSDQADPALIQQCATFFMEHRQFDRAVDLMATNKQLWEALKLCVEYNVPMTEELAEKLTPPKSNTGSESRPTSSISRIGAPPGEFTDSERSRLLEGVAEIAMSQRQYHVACKKFTQAGNQLMAMKSLLKSGDTQKIVFFANVAKTRDVYVLAANYLQTLDWRGDAEIIKNIVQFYTRGKAVDRLAAFYEACAQSEIEEYQNYQKALVHLGEAVKYWNKVKFDSESQKEIKLDQLQDRCHVIKQFIVAISSIESNPEQGLQQCQLLLDEDKLDRAVRYGDVYAVMIKFFMQQSKYKAAYSCLEEMKTRISNPSVVTAYLDIKILEALHKALNLPFRPPTTIIKDDDRKSSPDDNDDDIIDDEIAAAIDEDLN